MKILYQDNRILVCIKPAGVLSTDEPGGMPSLLRQALGDERACVRTVHRLDQVTGGVMVFARSRMAASVLGQQVQSGQMHKEYLAVLHGRLPEPRGALHDLLLRDAKAHLTRVVSEPGKDVQEAALEYETLECRDGLSLVRVRLLTGRTHQIRAQLSARGCPLYGDRKYGSPVQDTYPALFACRLAFCHPQSGEPLCFEALPEWNVPWSAFSEAQLLPAHT